MTKKNLFVELTVTDNCNCNCKYCFERKHVQHKTFDLKEQQRQISLLVDLADNLDLDKYETLTISFWGGEPFLNLDYVINIIKQTYKHEYVRYNFYSNGTLVDAYKMFLNMDFMSSIKDRTRIQLSYDGEPIHSLQRADNSKQIFEVADMLKDKGVKFSFKATLPFSMIERMPEAWESYRLLYAKYGNIVSYSPTLDTNDVDLSKLKEFEDTLLKICAKEFNFIRCTGHTLLSWFNSEKMSCNINDSIFMHDNGDIMLCHGCPYKCNNDNLKVSNTKVTKHLIDIIENMQDVNLELKSSCQNCSATYCAICHITTFGENDDPYSSWSKKRDNNESRCKFFKLFGKYNKLLNYSVIKYRRSK